MARIRWYGPTLLLILTVVLAMVLGPGMVRQIARSYETARIEQVRKDLVENPTLLTLSDAFKDVATVIRPSVTSISLQARDRSSSSPGSGRLISVSNGSGWVYRHFGDDGGYHDYIVTNYHVVEDLVFKRADQAVVRFVDGGEYKAKVLGFEKKSDIAVLEIDRSELEPAALAMDPAQQGEIVFAVGSPFQFEFSMSQGIVSATGRRLHASVNNYENFIQTDAAINPGNSGGPLTNVRGEVIGMNTAIAVEGNPAATFSGLGFAIPIDQIVNVVEQLIENGEVKRGYIGVRIYDVDFATKQAMGFDGLGVLCDPVAGEPADLAGVRLGDIITHVDGDEVATIEELRIAVSSHPPGATIPLRVWRDGGSRSLRLTLAESPDSFSASSGLRNPFEAEPTLAIDGLGQFTSYTPAAALQNGRAYHPGVVVLSVEDGTAAQRLGLGHPALIAAVDGRPVYDMTSFAEAIDGAAGASVRLRVLRWDIRLGGYEERVIELPTP